MRDQIYLVGDQTIDLSLLRIEQSCGTFSLFGDPNSETDSGALETELAEELLATFTLDSLLHAVTGAEKLIEDSALSVDLSGNATGGSGGALTFALVSRPANGDVSVSPTGAFSYKPAPNFSGVDSFVYNVTTDTGIGPVTARGDQFVLVRFRLHDHRSVGVHDDRPAEQPVPILNARLGDPNDPAGVLISARLHAER